MDLVALNFLLLNLHPAAETSMLIDVLKYKNVNNAVNFHCNIQNAFAMQKVFNKNRIFISSEKFDYNASYNIPVSPGRLGFILNTSCEDWTLVLDKIYAKVTFKAPFTWLFITKNLSSTVEDLSHYPIEIDSDAIVVLKDINDVFLLYEVYNTGFYTNGEYLMKKIGYWKSNLHVKTLKRIDLSGVILKCTVVVTQKLVNETFEEHVERSMQSKYDTLHKLKYFTLLKYLRDMYNFSYNLQRTNSWGYLRNNSFDGMIGTLERREVDIGGSPIFFRLERAKVLTAPAEVWTSRPLFILRHPKHPGGYYSIFTRPLTNRVWYCVLASLMMSGVILCLMLKLKLLKVPGDDEDSSLSLALLTIWSATCQQGTTLIRNSTSIKLVTFVTCVFTLTIYQYYNAVVVSTLLREPPKNIRTPKDLLNSNLKAGVHDVLYNKDFFKQTKEPIALEMYSKKIVTAEEYNFFTLEHGMALVKKGGVAFLVDAKLAYAIMRRTFSEKELCDAHEIALYPPQNMVAVVKKGSPYREHFAYGLRKMFESGLMQRIKLTWDDSKPACVRTPGSMLISVSIREFSVALLALAGGMLAAGLLLACEILAFKFANREEYIHFRH